MNVHGGLVAYGNWLFHYRDKVFPVVMLVLFAGFTPVLFGGSLSSDRQLDALGFGLALLGQTYRWLVIGLAYIKRGGLNKRVHAHALVTDGLFAHVRNPLYGGNLLIIAGLLIVHHAPAVYVLGGAYFVLTYIAIVAAEEAYLREKFSDYADYCRRVPRWWPRWSGLGATLTGMRFNWRRAVLKDSASCAMWVLTGLGILALEAWHWGGMSALEARAPGLLAGAGLAIGTALFILQLKKRGVLTG